MNIDISQFKTLIFDCDGVILDSNKVKSRAFYNAAFPYGKNEAEELVTYHKNNGGISRYVKFEYFLKNIVGVEVMKKNLDLLLVSYALEVHSGLKNCQVSKGLKTLRKSTESNWLIASGGDQNELRDVFNHRHLNNYFDGGIFGSPDSKELILLREIDNNNIKYPALFLGDSKYDHEAAKSINCNFVFISQWTDFENWEEYCLLNNVENVASVSDLIN